MFDAQFKAESVRLCLRANRSITQVASDLDLTETALRQWVKRAQIDADTGPVDALTTAERQELAQLRRDNKRLLMERDILKKHTKWQPGMRGNARRNNAVARRNETTNLTAQCISIGMKFFPKIAAACGIILTISASQLRTSAAVLAAAAPPGAAPPATSPAGSPPVQRSQLVPQTAYGPLSITQQVAETPWKDRQEAMRRNEARRLTKDQIHDDTLLLSQVMDLFFVARTPEDKIALDVRARDFPTLEKLAPYSVEATYHGIHGVGERARFCTRPPDEMFHCAPDFKAHPRTPDSSPYEVKVLPSKLAMLVIRDL